MKRTSALWSEEDVRYLREKSRMFSAEYIGIRLNRSADSVRMKASRLGVRFTDYATWSPEETRFLEENAETLTAEQIADRLGRPANSVRTKAWHSGIELKKFMKFSDEDVAICKALHQQGIKLDL